MDTYKRCDIAIMFATMLSPRFARIRDPKYVRAESQDNKSQCGIRVRLQQDPSTLHNICSTRKSKQSRHMI